MKTFATVWSWWVARCAQPEDARAMALVRILVALAVVGDLLGAWARGVGPLFFAPFAEGGVSVNTSPAYVLGDLLGSGSGWVAAGAAVVGYAAAALGVAPRLGLLVGVLGYAQLAALGPDADRAVDRALRTVSLLLLCTQSHRAWVLQARWRGAALAQVPRWQPGLIRWFLVLVYTAAGLVKVGALAAAPAGAAPALYRILTDPTAARLDHLAWVGWDPWFAALWIGAISVELTSPLLLTRWAPVWGLFGLSMHLGIAATMGLGVFSWGMLALYPVVFARWWPQSQHPTPGDRV